MRRPDGLAVQVAYPFYRLICTCQIGRHQHFAVVGERPGTCIKEFVEGRLNGESIVYRIGATMGMPLYVGCLTSEIEATKAA
jgi:hypothetical protein